MTIDASGPKLQLTPSLAVLFGVHFSLDIALISSSWIWSPRLLTIALAIPLSQLALLTIWAAIFSINQSTRFVVPILSAAGCWFILSRILPWGTGEAASAGWAFALFVQVITIFVALSFYRQLRYLRLADETHLERHRPPSQFRFGMSTMMLWTTAVGLVFGFIQFGQYHWQWTASVFQWELLGAMPIIGMTSGVVAVLWLWTFAAGELAKRAVRIVICMALSSGLALLESYSTKWATGASVLSLDESFLFLAAQSVVIALSLAIVVSNASRNQPKAQGGRAATREQNKDGRSP